MTATSSTGFARPARRQPLEEIADQDRDVLAEGQRVVGRPRRRSSSSIAGRSSAPDRRRGCTMAIAAGMASARCPPEARRTRRPTESLASLSSAYRVASSRRGASCSRSTAATSAASISPRRTSSPAGVVVVVEGEAVMSRGYPDRRSRQDSGRGGHPAARRPPYHRRHVHPRHDSRIHEPRRVRDVALAPPEHPDRLGGHRTGRVLVEAGFRRVSRYQRCGGRRHHRRHWVAALAESDDPFGGLARRLP